MTQVDIPTRSVEARSAISVLFQDINEIDIYTEDTAKGYEKLFTNLFSRVFEGKYKVGKVFPLGGRGPVIEQYNKDNSSRKPYLYVVDGDLNLLAGDTIQNTEGLYRLPFYCIENIFCDIDSIIEIINQEEPVLKTHQLKSKFDYRTWEHQHKDKLFELFIEYAIARELKPDLQTVHHGCHRLLADKKLSKHKGCVSDDLINGRIDEVKNAVICATSLEQYNAIKQDILDNFNNSSFDKFDVISGKDYLFPLLRMRAQSVIDVKLSNTSFEQRLSYICDISKILNAQSYVKIPENIA